jgi:hypothetical protein
MKSIQIATTALLALAVPVFTQQHVGHRAAILPFRRTDPRRTMVHRRHTPNRNPLNSRSPATSAISRVIPMYPTSTKARSGLVMTPARMTRPIISTTPGHMDTSTEASVRTTSGNLPGAAQAGSGSAGGSGLWLLPT